MKMILVVRKETKRIDNYRLFCASLSGLSTKWLAAITNKKAKTSEGLKT